MEKTMVRKLVTITTIMIAMVISNRHQYNNDTNTVHTDINDINSKTNTHHEDSNNKNTS